MTSARDELLHLVNCLDNAECKRALELLAPLTRPHCPLCWEEDLDRLEWQEDDEHVTCFTCGTVWRPNCPPVNNPL